MAGAKVQRWREEVEQHPRVYNADRIVEELIPGRGVEREEGADEPGR